MLTRAKASALLVLSAEALDGSAPQVETLIGRELRRAVSVSTDAQFLGGLVQGVTPTGATGTILGDIAALADAVEPNAASRLFLIVSPDVVRRLALVEAPVGARGLPTVNVDGGDIGGIRVIPSDSLPVSGSPPVELIVMINAPALATADDGLGLDVAQHASVEMSDTPVQDATTPTASQVVSLWQNNLRGIRVERRFGWHKLTSTAVATMAGGSW